MHARRLSNTNIMQKCKFSWYPKTNIDDKLEKILMHDATNNITDRT
jgi:hypothetical protein